MLLSLLIGDPHIGHAYEAITTDVMARYQRMRGRRVHFMTGSDEHGQKIANTAARLGLEPIDICDKFAGESIASHVALSLLHTSYALQYQYQVSLCRYSYLPLCLRKI